MYERIKRTKFISWILRLFNLNYSCCKKCGLPWNHCNPYTVYTYSNSSNRTGTFATCDVCWNNSTLEELKQYYAKTYQMQLSSLIRIKVLSNDMSDFTMEHSLDHLLMCVEKEYNKTHKIY